MQKLVLRYSLTLFLLLFFGYGSSFASVESEANQVTICKSQGNAKSNFKVTLAEVREGQEDRYETQVLSKFIECSLFFNSHGQALGLYSYKENFPQHGQSLHNSSDQYLILRVFRI